MIQRNPHLDLLKKNYLFVEINQKKEAYLKEHPEKSLISFGIGDTSRPLPHTAIKGLMHAAVDQGSTPSYVGYGPDQGLKALREKIAEHFYSGQIDSSEIFISDGAKCDTSRLQVLLGNQNPIAMQDPVYPVYLDGSQLMGAQNIIQLPCTPENDFMPHLNDLPKHCVLYLCSPNNPTGVAFTHKQLQDIIQWAKKNASLILFDAAYSAFIQDAKYAKSIYEVSGSKEVAIEINSFSKLAGFTGVRLGWTVVPKELRYSNQASLYEDWKRVFSTTFNGASILSQKAGLALLTKEGLEEIQTLIDEYMNQAKRLKEVLLNAKCEVYGADQAPYLWVRMPSMSSWEAFDFFLKEAQLITTPGSGFGASGEGFVRFSAFCPKEQMEEGLCRLENALSKHLELTQV